MGACTHEAAKLIGRLSQGGMRDAISLLELCSGSGQTIDIALVNRTAGVTGRPTVSRIVGAVLKKDIPEIFTVIAEFTAASTDLAVFWQELIGYYRDMLVIRSVKDYRAFLDLTDEEIFDTKDRAEHFTRERLLHHIRTLEDAYNAMQRGGALKRICAEMTLVRLTDDRLSETPEALLSRIATLEEKLASGNFTVTAPKELTTPSTDSIQAIVTEANTSTPQVSITPESGKPLPSWAEIVETVERTDNGAAAMLRLGRGYLCGDKVTVKVSDHFSKMLLERDTVKAAIASAINLSGDAESIRPQQITIMMEKIDLQEDDPLASLND